MNELQLYKMSNTWAEDEIGKKWDRCFTDAFIKLGGGVLIGTTFSLLFFRRKWPIIVGAGFGLGIAFSNCEKDINESVSQCAPKSRCEDVQK